jgi:hypothetical protein
MRVDIGVHLSRDGRGHIKVDTMKPTATPILLRIPDACSRWGWSRSFLYERIADGDIEAVKVGAGTRVVTASGDAYVKSLPRLPSKQSAGA